MLPHAASNSMSPKVHSSSIPQRAAADGRGWAQWKQQLNAYVAWVNSQLKKKPGAHLIEDLRHDIRDGVALSDLVQVIGGEVLEGVHPSPSNYAEMRDNVDKVLHFMSTNHIKMHHITTRDIVEGNLKSTMRLILALAAHYKPNSVRHSSSSQGLKENITGIAQGAAAALTEARRSATRAGHRYRRRRHKEERPDQNYSDSDHQRAHGSYHRIIPEKPGMKEYSKSFPTSQYSTDAPHSLGSNLGPSIRETLCEYREDGGRAELEGASGSSSPINSHTASPRASLYLSDPPSSMEGLLPTGTLMSASCESDSLTDSGYTEVCKSIQDIHSSLFQLHSLLLNGDEGDNYSFQAEQLTGVGLQEKISVLKERLLNTEEVSGFLKMDLSKVKKDCIDLQGTKHGLEQRLSEQDQHLSATKTKAVTLELQNQELAAHVESFKKQIADKDQVLSDMRETFVKQMEERDKTEADLKKELLKRDQAIEKLREQMSYINRENEIKDEAVKAKSEPSKVGITEFLPEVEAVRDSLALVRTHITGPEGEKQSSVDSLENNIVRLLNKINPCLNATNELSSSKAQRSTATPVQTQRISPTKEPRMARGNSKTGNTRTTFSRGTPSRGTSMPATATSRSSSRISESHQTPKGGNGASTRQGLKGKTVPSGPGAESQAHQTQVVYYTNQTDKPLSCTLQKNCSITKTSCLDGKAK